MECKDEAAVERQKLVDDGEVENEDDQTNVIPPTTAPKSVQTPNSPVLSNRVSLISSFQSICLRFNEKILSFNVINSQW